MNYFDAPQIFPVVVECNSALVQQDVLELIEDQGYAAYKLEPEQSQLEPSPDPRLG